MTLMLKTSEFMSQICESGMELMLKTSESYMTDL